MSEFDETADLELEEIVAYLDGELSSEACARVERRLASDEDYRQELQGVERAWVALGELPMETVDDRFARTTMSMVIEVATDEVQSRTRALPVQRRRRWVTTALATATAAALGFLAFRLAWHDPNAMLLADLPVIENIDIYSQFTEVGFLRELRKIDGELEQLNGDERDLQQLEGRFERIAVADDGADWLASLNGDQKSSLRSKYNRFRELPESEKQRLRELHSEIMSAKDSASLVHTMLAYQQWLGGLPPVRQFELRDVKAADQRVAKVRDWSAWMRTNEALTLADDELIEFFKQLSDPVYALRAGSRHNNRGNDRDRLKDMASGEMASRWRGELFEQFSDYKDGQPAPFYRAVLNALPEHAKEAFAGLPPHERVNRFITWVRQHTACRGEVTDEELAEFFAKELDPKARAQLLSMPASEMKQSLLRMYRCEPQSRPVTSWSWPHLGPGPFGPPPGPPMGVRPDREERGNYDHRENGERENGQRENGDRRNGRDRDGRDNDRGRDSDRGRGDERRDGERRDGERGEGRGGRDRGDDDRPERPTRPPLDEGRRSA